MAIDQDPLNISVDDSGAVTFDVLSNPTTATIALYGLENTDLDVTSLGAGWTDAGTYAYFEPFFAGTDTDPVLNLTIGRRRGSPVRYRCHARRWFWWWNFKVVKHL